MGDIVHIPHDDQLTPELDAQIQTLSHEEAIGVIRSLLSGAWIDGDAMRLAIRVQRRAGAATEKDLRP